MIRLTLAILALALGGAMPPAVASDEARVADFAGERIILPDVTLVDQNGLRRALKSEIAGDGLVVVNFNYATCESICPVGNAVMAEVDRLAPGAIGRPVRLLSITIDPARDTPAALARASEPFAPSERWFWLTGATADVDQVLRRADVPKGDILFHPPVFLVGDPQASTFLRSIASPDAEEILGMLRSFES